MRVIRIFLLLFFVVFCFYIHKFYHFSDLAAFPESVNILPAVKGDPRTSENLIDGVNDTTRFIT